MLRLNKIIQSLVKRTRHAIARLLQGMGLSLLTAFGSTHALSIDEARHVLDRTGMGAAPHEIAALLPLSQQQAIERLLTGINVDISRPVSPPPAFLSQDVGKDYMRRFGENFPDHVLKPLGVHVPKVSPETDERLTQKGMIEMDQLRAWWLDQMISTQSPQAEKLALFWHGHFTSKYFEVLGPKLMYGQLQTIRKYGAENFSLLLTEILRDPAMLIFLDNATSGKKAINENLARELLELFTMGAGNYSQKDISELARALAGNSVDIGRSWGFRYRQDFADHGLKTILGRVGKFKADDVPPLLLSQDRVSEFLVEKLWREYVSPDPDAKKVKEWAKEFRKSGYQIKPLLRVLWSSEEFWQESNRSALTKSPVELLVGAIRSHQIYMPDAWMLLRHTKVLGHELFEPPTVAGWTGGAAWVKARDIELRRKAIEQLWIAKENELDWVMSTQPDLILRIGGHVADAGQVIRYRINGNGRELKSGQLKHPMVSSNAVDVAIGITFETLVIKREELPKDLESVEIEMLVDKNGMTPSGSALFVNWIEFEGQRLSAHNARPKWPSSGACGNPGMMYCGSSMVMNLADRKSDPQLAALEDRNLGQVKTEIDRATARMPLALSPAGIERTRSGSSQKGHSSFDGMFRTSPEGWMRSVLSNTPLLVSSRGTPDFVKQLTLDPVFNLK